MTAHAHDGRPLSPWPTRPGMGALPPATPFGRNLRAARLARGLGLRELALRVGVSRTSLSDIERGVRPPSAVVRAKLWRELGAEL